MYDDRYGAFVCRPRARALGFVAVIAAVFNVAAAAAADDDVDFFEKRIRPIFVERCESCHSAASGKTNGGLALDTRDGWMKGGEAGSPIVAGKPDESLLIRAVRYGADGPQMPPKEKGGKLPDNEIAALTEWVSRVHSIRESQSSRWRDDTRRSSPLVVVSARSKQSLLHRSKNIALAAAQTWTDSSCRNWIKKSLHPVRACRPPNAAAPSAARST